MLHTNVPLQITLRLPSPLRSLHMNLSYRFQSIRLAAADPFVRVSVTHYPSLEPAGVPSSEACPGSRRGWARRLATKRGGRRHRSADWMFCQPRPLDARPSVDRQLTPSVAQRTTAKAKQRRPRSSSAR